ncbi:MAG: sulfotransferase [Methylococcaceae bacterium]|nr:sulfotransferase [Methylococcaceae bacterium]
MWFDQLMDSDINNNKWLTDFSNLTCLISASDWKILNQEYDNLRVIYIMRDPVKRLWSHYKFHIQFSGHPLSKNPTMNFDHFKKVLSKDFFIRNAYYSRVIKNLSCSLNQNQYFLCYFEEMVTEPHAFLRKIEDFLSVQHIEYDFENLSKSKNASIDVAIPESWREYGINLLEEEIASLKSLGYWSSAWSLPNQG